jgi:hypothetical protein
LLGTLDPVSTPGGENASLATRLVQFSSSMTKWLTVPDTRVLTVRVIGLTKIWIWAVPAMIPIAVLGLWRHRSNVALRLLLASAISTLIGFLFVPFDQGHGWGFRYFHSAWFVLPVLAAAAVAPPSKEPNTDAGAPDLAIAGYVCGTAILSLLVLTPYFLWQVHDFIGQHLAQLPQAKSGRPQVLVIDPSWGYYAADLVENDPFLREPTIKMVTHGPDADKQMIASHFPGLVKLGGDYRGSVYGMLAEGVTPGRGPGSEEKH